MTAPGSTRFSINAASRGDISLILTEVVQNSVKAFLTLEVNKGDELEDAIALLLSDASGAARQVFGDAMSDVLQASIERYMNQPDADNVDQLLHTFDLLEIALEQNIPFKHTAAVGLLKVVIEQGGDIATLAAARILTYFASQGAVSILKELYSHRPDDPTLAAYLLDARSRSDPLTAFGFPLDQLEATAFRSTVELTLAVQAAIGAMFEANGRMAEAALAVASREWPAALCHLVLDVLRDVPLKDNHWAGQAANQLARLTQPTQYTGVARRIIERTGTDRRLSCIGGYSMTAAASSPARFTQHTELWMKRVAEETCNILHERYAGTVEIGHRIIPWPTGQPWINVFRRVRADALQPIDICFEMVYLSRHRASDFSVVELATLKTFTVVYHPNNRFIREYFDEQDTKHEFDASANNFMRYVSKQDQGVQQICTLPYNAAGEMILDFVDSVILGTNQFRLCDDSTQLLGNLRDNAAHTVVICDNVVANELEDLGEHAFRITLDTRRLDYPTPIPVGLVHDLADQAWGDILHEALLRTAMTLDTEVKVSLTRLFSDLEAIGAFATDEFKVFAGGHVGRPSTVSEQTTADEQP